MVNLVTYKVCNDPAEQNTILTTCYLPPSLHRPRSRLSTRISFFFFFLLLHLRFFLTTMDQTNPFDPRFGRFPSSGNTIVGGNSSTASPSVSAVGLKHDSISYSTTPPPSARGGYHRRAHSENFLRISEDFLFDSDTDFSLADIDFPSLSDENGANSGGLFPPNSAAEVACVKESEKKGKRKSSERPTSGAHLRSLSVDTALFEGLGLSEQGGGITGSGSGEGGGGMGNTIRHRHSSSMDGLNSPFEAESPEPMDYTKKAMAADKLAELALLDPKRAKRFLFYTLLNLRL